MIKENHSNQVGIRPTLVKFGNTEKTIFHIVSKEEINLNGFRKWNGYYEAGAVSPLLGTDLEELAKKYLEDIYWIKDGENLYIFGDTFNIKEELKALGFKWGGYNPVPHWKIKYSPVIAKVLNDKYNLDITIPKKTQKDYSNVKIWEPSHRPLWDHQIAGVRRVLNHPVGGLLAWEMGTGKTVAGFSAAKSIGGNVLFVVKAFLRYNVYDEAVKCGLKPVLLPPPKTKTVKITDENGDKKRIKNPYNRFSQKEGDVFITSYTNIGKKIKTPEKAKELINNFDVVVCDESTAIKNYKANRTKGVQLLSDAAKNSGAKLIFMSGTPTMNKPAELWTTLKILDPFTENYFEFTEKYNDAHYEHFGANKYWVMGQPSSQTLIELHNKLRTTVMDRVLKENCLDLPEKIRTDIQLKGVSVVIPEYPEDDSKLLGWLNQYKASVAKAKVKETVELATTSTPCIIFTDFVMEGTHPAIVAGLEKENLRVGSIRGEISEFDRQRQNKEFSEGKLDVLVIQIQTGGMGLNLPRAKNVIFNDMPWNPGWILQAEDRAHRYDDSDRSEEEKKKPITVTLMVSDDELDQKIFKVVTKKFASMAAVHDGKIDEELTGDSVFKEVKNFFIKKMKK